MYCHRKTLFVDERVVSRSDVDVAWLAMTDDTKDDYIEAQDRLDEAGRRSCGGKTFEYRFPSMAELIIPEDVLRWLAMTLPTRRASNAAIDKLNPEFDW